MNHRKNHNKNPAIVTQYRVELIGDLSKAFLSIFFASSRKPVGAPSSTQPLDRRVDPFVGRRQRHPDVPVARSSIEITRRSQNA